MLNGTKMEEIKEQINDQINLDKPKCVCGGELKLVEDFFKQGGIKRYNEMAMEFEKVVGRKWTESTDYNCIKCGQVYNENFIHKGYKIAWLQERVGNIVNEVLDRIPKIN